jgi:hypothetical protein
MHSRYYETEMMIKLIRNKWLYSTAHINTVQLANLIQSPVTYKYISRQSLIQGPNMAWHGESNYGGY